MPQSRRQRREAQQQQQQDGGRRKKMRKTRKAGKWPQFVKKTYMDMKKKDRSTTFKQAMKEASARKKRGEY
jgi:hypothetical protein